MDKKSLNNYKIKIPIEKLRIKSIK